VRKFDNAQALTHLCVPAGLSIVRPRLAQPVQFASPVVAMGNKRSLGATCEGSNQCAVQPPEGKHDCSASSMHCNICADVSGAQALPTAG
jgi:hypothetical protein